MATTDSGRYELLQRPANKGKSKPDEELTNRTKVDAFFEFSLLEAQEFLDGIEERGSRSDDVGQLMSELSNRIRQLKYEHRKIVERFGDDYRNVRDDVLGVAYHARDVARQFGATLPASLVILDHVADIETAMEPR